jgi:hypothetical protein
VNQPISNPPRYNAKPIRSVGALARALDVDANTLLDLANRADALYRVAKRIIKKDGSIRVTYDALPELKNVHRKIKFAILSQVSFPPYLTGGLKGQDYKTNAALHVGSTILIAEDIGSFFPSTKTVVVRDVWRNFFSFSDDVAECLTKITVLQGALPQGAITSPHLANLVFWKIEPPLQAQFCKSGLIYSRFVDDISLSSKHEISNEEKARAISKIFGMMIDRGYSPKREKHEIMTSKNRIVVTKLGVNEKPGLDKKKRSQIRAMVHHLENLTSEMAAELIPKVAGQIALLKRFHPGEAVPLKRRLDVVKDRTFGEAGHSGI